MRWIVHLDGGPRRVNHAAVCIGDKIYSFGGYCSTEEYKDWDPIPVYVLETSTLRWRPVCYSLRVAKRDLTTLPFQRYAHSTVVYGHKVYMWGGRNNAVACDTLSCFDTKKCKWSLPPVTGTMPYAKDGHSACVIKNKMFIFGGFEYIFDQFSQDVHCLNLDTMQWTYLNPRGRPPSHRDFHTAVSYGNRMYIYGGRGNISGPYNSEDEIYCPHVFYLDTVNELWVNVKATGKWPQPRRSHSAWIYKGFMYIFGGLNAKTKTHFNDVHRYSIFGNYWEEVIVHGNGPCARRRQACINYQDKVYLFGGTSPCTQYHHHHLRHDELDDSTERLMDNNDLHVLDFSPTLRTLAMVAVVEYGLDISPLPHNIMVDIRNMTVPNHITRSLIQFG